MSEIGADVKSFKPGDRVAYTGIPGAYAEYVAVPADRLVLLPPGITEQQAAAAMLQGMTAHYLVYDTYPLKKGETALIHAAAGGVGLLLVQMAKKHRSASHRDGRHRGKSEARARGRSR